MSAAPFDLYSAPVTRPGRTATRVRSKRGFNVAQTVAEAACVFVLAIVSTYGLSVLTGKSLSERARLDAGSYQARSRAARSELGSLQQRFEMKANPRRVADWALNNGLERDATRETTE